jgi:hypothetical protein
MENGRRITGKNADGWWGFLLKKEFVNMGYNSEGGNNTEHDDDDTDSLSDNMSSSMITSNGGSKRKNKKYKSTDSTDNTNAIVNAARNKLGAGVLNKVIKTTGSSSTKVEEELVQDIVNPSGPVNKDEDSSEDTSECDSEDDRGDDSEDDSDDQSVI